MHRTLVLALACIFTATGPSGAGADTLNTCKFVDPITEYAAFVLDKRGDLQKFKKRRFGTDALHLLIHYNAMPGAEIRQHLVRLKAAKVGLADELAVSWAYGAGDDADRDWLTTTFKPDPAVDYSVLKALLEFDNGKALFRYLDQLETADVRYHRQFGAVLTGHITATWSDERNATFVWNAIAAGYPEFAATALFVSSDRDVYHRFVANNASDEAVRLQDAQTLFNSLLTVPNNTGPLTKGTDRAEANTRFYPILRLGYLMGEADFTLIALNQTGREQEIMRAANRVLAKIDDGTLDPVTDPDAGWIAAFEAMIAELGRDGADDALTGYEIARLRHYSITARDFLDWVMAARAVRDHFRSGADGDPPKPANLQAKFDWSGWVETANAVRAGTFDPIATRDAQATRVAVEVLFAAEKFGAVGAAVVTSDLKLDAQLKILRDFALRLDRRCLKAAVAPGQAVILGGQTVFRFDR